MKWAKVLDVAKSERGLHYHFPKNPFECRVPGGLSDGRKVYIHAFCPANSEKFTFNFQIGADIALHLNPRFHQSTVVMNSKAADEWGSEQRIRMSLKHNSPFLICVTTLQEGYEVEINDEWAASFDHRLPYDQVTSISIDGDVDIIGVHILNAELHKENLITIPGGVEMGQSFTVHGKCNSDFSAFYLNLQCGDSVDEDVAFHFNPRGGDANQVIRNALISGSWGDEERDGDFPFAPGSSFVIGIDTSVEKFNVQVNGTSLAKYSYSHRLPIARICRLSLQGDAKMNDVNIHVPSTMQVPTRSIEAELTQPETPAKLRLVDFGPGSSVSIVGTVQNDPSRFKINLQSGPEEEDDIMLHFNPRWDQGEPKIVMNSREGGSWADEEMWGPAFPFKESSQFAIQITCHYDGYLIAINDDQQDFKHRISFSKVSYLFVNGNVDLKDILVTRE